MASYTNLLNLLLQDSGTANFHTALNAALQAIDDLAGGMSMIPGTAGEAISAYEVTSVNASGGIILADGTDETKLRLISMADADIANGVAGVVRRGGYFTNGSWTWSGAGKKLFVSSTPGALTETRPSNESPCVGITLGTTSIILDETLIRAVRTVQKIGTVAGGEAEFVMPHFNRTMEATRIMILSDTATSGSDAGNNVGFTLQNLTQAAVVATDDTNGNELVLDGLMTFGSITNADINPDDVLEIQTTVTGAPTSLAAANVYIVMEAELKF